MSIAGTSPPLITLAGVHDWLNDSPSKPFPPGSDDLLTRMIGSVSQFAVTYLSRPIAPVTFTEFYNGTGGTGLPLRRTPVIQVRSLTVDVTSVPARPSFGQYGFIADDRSVYIDGGAACFGGVGQFRRGIQNVQVVYDAGFQTSDLLTVPSPPTVTADELSSPWNSDRGVAYSGGAALTLVTSAPSTGQYQITTDALGNTTYTFAVGDEGRSVVITYGFTPSDLAQALIEMLGERYKTRERIGQVSKTVGPAMTTAFSQKDMNAGIKAIFQQYRSVTPV